jgi:hypothetical protein
MNIYLFVDIAQLSFCGRGGIQTHDFDILQVLSFETQSVTPHPTYCPIPYAALQSESSRERS